MAHVDAEYRGAAVADEFRRTEDRAVAAEHDRELEGRRTGGGIQHLDVREERIDRGELRVVVGRQDGAHSAPRRASITRRAAATVSTRPAWATTRILRSFIVPCQPVDGVHPFCRIAAAARHEVDEILRIAVGSEDREETIPAIPIPASHALHATRATASARVAGSVTRPPRTAVRPTSNCGLTSSRTSEPGAATATTAGSTSSSEMKERSPTTRSGEADSPSPRRDCHGSCAAR